MKKLLIKGKILLINSYYLNFWYMFFRGESLKVIGVELFGDIILEEFSFSSILGVIC